MSSTRQESSVHQSSGAAASARSEATGRHVVTAEFLVRASAVAAILAGIAFMGVQIGHPQLDTTSITTTNVYVRDQLKILMSVLALAGITGMYLSQIRRNGILGLIGYLLLAGCYLLIMCDDYAAAYIFPEIAKTDPGFVHDVIVLDTARGSVKGDPGAVQIMTELRAVCYLSGGLLFGIALYRANVLARWASALLAVGGVVSIALSLMPDAFYRLLAFPNAIALIGLGYSLWRTTRTSTTAQSSADPVLASRPPSPSDDGTTIPRTREHAG
jgi:hypothetical protein